MTNLHTVVKRQIEIVGLAVDNHGHFKVPDLAYAFGCDDLTIKRDMQALRKSAIDIHSEKKRGVTLVRRLPPTTLRQLVGQYLGLCAAATARDRATALLVKKHRERALRYVVLLQRCIEQNHVARIDYEKETGNVERDREIHPLMLFSGDGHWRVLAVNGGKMKQYLLTKITRLQETSTRFRPVPQERIDEMFRHSFRSWIGTEAFAVRIRLSPTWAARLRPRQLMETEALVEEEDGSVVLEATVNSLEEVAGWVVSRGTGVEVLEPPKLRAMVLDLARGVLANYGADTPGGRP
jgi:predicted DNA-binding transcriptional regulator YafY